MANNVEISKKDKKGTTTISFTCPSGQQATFPALICDGKHFYASKGDAKKENNPLDSKTRVECCEYFFEIYLFKNIFFWNLFILKYIFLTFIVWNLFFEIFVLKFIFQKLIFWNLFIFRILLNTLLSQRLRRYIKQCIWQAF